MNAEHEQSGSPDGGKRQPVVGLSGLHPPERADGDGDGEHLDESKQPVPGFVVPLSAGPGIAAGQ